MRRKKNITNGGAGTTTTTTTHNTTQDDTTEDDTGTTTEEEDTSEKVILEISVTDTGIGMPADRLPRLFKSFSQIDISTARRYGGTGLGLAISSMLVNRMGGGLWVESEEGLGSRFALTLPLTIAPKRPAGTASSSIGSGVHSENSSNYASSGMIASPPSPGSSLSDGGSSIGDRSANESFTNIPSSPSNSTGYFPQQQQNTINNSTRTPTKYPSSSATTPTTTHPWEPINIPSTPSPSTASFDPNNITPSSKNNKELHNMISKSKFNNCTDPSEEKPKSRITLSKSYHRKSPSQSNEENLALLYPIKIMLAEDNVCKFPFFFLFLSFT